MNATMSEKTVMLQVEVPKSIRARFKGIAVSLQLEMRALLPLVLEHFCTQYEEDDLPDELEKAIGKLPRK